MTQEKDHKGERETGLAKGGASQTLVGVPKLSSTRPPASSRPPRPTSQAPAGPKPGSGPLARAPSGSGSALRGSGPRTPPHKDAPLDRLPLEEISSSLLLPDETSSTTALPGLEELSGSLLLEDPGDGRVTATAGPLGQAGKAAGQTAKASPGVDAKASPGADPRKLTPASVPPKLPHAADAKPASGGPAKGAPAAPAPTGPVAGKPTTLADLTKHTPSTAPPKAAATLADFMKPPTPAPAAVQPTPAPAAAPTQVQPSAPTQRALPMPALPTTTPAPNLETLPTTQMPSLKATLPPAALVVPVAPDVEPDQMPTVALPAISISASGVATSGDVPPPPAHMYEALQGYEASPPAGAPVAPTPAEGTAPSGGAPQAAGPSLEAPAPTAPVQGDVEVTALPRGKGVVLMDAVRHAFANGRDSFEQLKESFAASAAPQGPRRRLFLAGIALAGLVVGVAVVGIVVSLTRKNPEEADARTEPALSASLAPSAATPPSTKNAAIAETAPAASAAAPAVPALSAPPESPASTTACKVEGKPRVVAPGALVQAGVEVRTVGNDVVLGFAPNEHQATAIRFDAANMSAGSTIDAQSADAIRRVVPLGAADGSLTLAADADHEGDALRGRRTIPLDPPLEVGATGGNLVWAHPGGPAAGKLWPLEGDGNVEAIRAATEVEPSGPLTAITMRLGGAIWVGTASGRESLTPMGPLYKAGGSTGSVGSPAVAINDGVVLVAWADRAEAKDPWRLRWVRFKAGEVPGEPGTFTPPAGGKGEQAMSPGITAVPGGRFLLVWTEGPAAKHDVRALTLSREGQPIGKPLDISNKTGNSGQGQAALNGTRQGLVAFLESNEGGFKVVATPIACGP